MDITRNVLTDILIWSTESEKVFTPWWVTMHHYLIYTLVIFGKMLFFCWLIHLKMSFNLLPRTP